MQREWCVDSARTIDYVNEYERKQCSSSFHLCFSRLLIILTGPKDDFIDFAQTLLLHSLLTVCDVQDIIFGDV